MVVWPGLNWLETKLQDRLPITAKAIAPIALALCAIVFCYFAAWHASKVDLAAIVTPSLQLPSAPANSSPVATPSPASPQASPFRPQSEIGRLLPELHSLSTLLSTQEIAFKPVIDPALLLDPVLLNNKTTNYAGAIKSRLNQNWNDIYVFLTKNAYDKDVLDGVLNINDASNQCLDASNTLWGALDDYIRVLGAAASNMGDDRNYTGDPEKHFHQLAVSDRSFGPDVLSIMQGNVTYDACLTQSLDRIQTEKDTLEGELPAAQ